jgi:hypothetical protein
MRPNLVAFHLMRIGNAEVLAQIIPNVIQFALHID